MVCLRNFWPFFPMEIRYFDPNYLSVGLDKIKVQITWISLKSGWQKIFSVLKTLKYVLKLRIKKIL